ncbi:hypothetical protein CN931_10695 [Bacillus sp. AFS054943]|nr:hypothetical protein CN931_10695 [Bacillus sp. AFS054943]
MKIYRRFFEYIYHNLKYINDFFDISTIRQGISIYRQRMTIESYSTFHWNSLIFHQGRYFFHQLVFVFSSLVFSNSSLSST